MWKIAAFVCTTLLIIFLLWLMFGGKREKPVLETLPALVQPGSSGNAAPWWKSGGVDWMFVVLAILTSLVLLFLVMLTLARLSSSIFKWIEGVEREYSSSIGLAFIILGLGALAFLARPLIESKKDEKEKAK